MAFSLERCLRVAVLRRLRQVDEQEGCRLDGEAATYTSRHDAFRPQQTRRISVRFVFMVGGRRQGRYPR